MMNINPPNNFPAPWASAWGEDAYGYWQSFEIVDSKQGKEVQQIMRWIPDGVFKMGSPEDEAERIASEEKQHEVIIKQGFWLADTACTQALWQAVMGKNPSRFSEDSESKQYPVENISWHDSQDFIKKANQFLGEDFLRLPREAEWEYSCRAGTTTPFSTGEIITAEQANFNGKYPYKTKKASVEKGQYREKTMPVVSFSPNPWGLYQMHGNVWEWCYDVFQEDYATVHEPSDTSSRRVLRGGGWLSDARYLRSAFRYAYTPGYRYDGFGLRLAGGFDPQAGR